MYGIKSKLDKLHKQTQINLNDAVCMRFIDLNTDNFSNKKYVVNETQYYKVGKDKYKGISKAYYTDDYNSIEDTLIETHTFNMILE